MPDISEVFDNMPNFTKVYVITALCLGVLAFLRLVSPASMYILVPDQIWHPKFLLSFIYLGKASMGLLFELYFFSIIVGRLEMSYRPTRYADWWYMILLVGATVYLLEIVVNWNNYTLLSHAFNGALTYIFCKRNPNERMMLFFMFTIQARYLPFAQLVLSLLQDGNVYSGLIGIAAGHLYVYCKDVLPVSHKKDYLETPRWMMWAVNKVMNSSLPLVGQGGVAQAFARNAEGRRIFAGQGVRIG